MNEFDALRAGNVDNLKKELAVQKHSEKNAMKEATQGEGGMSGLPKLAQKQLKELATAGPKRPATKSDVKAFHRAIDAAEGNKSRNAKLADYKKVVQYVKLDKKCLSGAPNLDHADAQLAEIRSYFSGKGGVSMCHMMFVQGVRVVELAGSALGILEQFGLSPGFANHLMQALAVDPTLYNTELEEMRIELGGFEAGWKWRLASKTGQHWAEYSAGGGVAIKKEDEKQ